MVEIEDISKTRKRLRIEIPGLEIEEKIKRVLKETQKKVRMPGFRPGKVPLDIIEKKFGREIEQEVVDEIITEYYARAIEETNIRPVSLPVLEEELKFERSSPLKLAFIVDVRPEIKDLNYEDIKIEQNEVRVDDSEIEEALMVLQESKAAFEPVDEPAQENDLVIMDYEIPELNISYSDQVFEIGTDLFPLEFSQKLKDLKVYESVEFEAKFPDNYRNEELVGKTVKVKVTLKEVKRRKLPEIDDELAKDVGLDTLEELKNRIRDNILKRRQKDERFRQMGELLNKLVDSVDFEVPEKLLEDQLESDLEEYRKNSPDDQRDLSVIKEELTPQSIRKVKASIIIDIVGEKEGVKVTEDDIKRYIIDLSQRLLVSPEFIVKYYMSDYQKKEALKTAIYEYKVLEIILDKITQKG